jgi:hypothetical protein
MSVASDSFLVPIPAAATDRCYIRTRKASINVDALVPAARRAGTNFRLSAAVAEEPMARHVFAANR